MPLKSTSIIIGIVIALMVLLAAIWLIRLAVRTHLSRTGDRAPHQSRCRRCGYELTGLSVPRCPECGTLVGFNRPSAEMGIEEHELRL